MEQAWNKGMATGRSYDIIERGNGRAAERGGKEGNALTGNIEATSDVKLKKAFTSSCKTSNTGFMAWCVLVLNTFLCLALGKVTGVRWISFVGVGSVLLAFVGILWAFAWQTVNQIVRIVAKLKGKDRDFFREEEKECSLSKAAAEYCGFVKRVFNREQNEAKRDCNRYEVKYTRNLHVRNNARSYRSASRPMFARSSGDGGSDDSGDSDSGDSPGPSHHTALKLSKTFNGKSNSFSCPWRFSRAFGCRRMPRRKCSLWRWSA
jgi:hypothetical protein